MRNGIILNKKFFQFLLPAVLSSMAMSLNEFVDSIVVANMIDSNAMSLVNIAKAGYFSSDRTIEQYNNDIWHLEKDI